jgi:hypothetical protein
LLKILVIAAFYPEEFLFSLDVPLRIRQSPYPLSHVFLDGFNPVPLNQGSDLWPENQ